MGGPRAWQVVQTPPPPQISKYRVFLAILVVQWLRSFPLNSFIIVIYDLKRIQIYWGTLETYHFTFTVFFNMVDLRMFSLAFLTSCTMDHDLPWFRFAHAEHSFWRNTDLCVFQQLSSDKCKFDPICQHTPEMRFQSICHMINRI